jgi:hypothetical protein
MPSPSVTPAFASDSDRSIATLVTACGEARDAAHTAACPEATNPVNIPLYTRFRSDVVGEIQARNPLPATPMFRAAR